MKRTSLVKTPEAAKFMQMVSTKSGRKALLGDRTKYSSAIYNDVTFSHGAVREGLAKVAALANDPTRTEVQKQDAAKQVADKTVSVLQRAKASIENASATMQRQASEMIEEQFKADPNRAAIHSEIRVWIREQAVQSDGITKIREAMKSNSEVTAVLYHSPHFLLGLPEKIRKNIIVDGIEAHQPSAYAMLEHSGELTALAAKYPRAIQGVESSFYVSAIAEQAKLRVEI